MELPVIAVTMGDPNGIGPEVVVRTLANAAAWSRCRPFVVGDPAVMLGIEEVLRTGLRFREITDLGQAGFAPPTVDILRPEGLMVGPVRWGQLDAANGEVVARCFRAAFALVAQGAVQGVVSGPMSKEALHQAGYHYLQELDYMAELTGSRSTFTMGVAHGLWTVSATEHIAFEQIVGQITQARVLRYIRQMQDVLLRVGVAEPRLGVAALNPHGGEGGLFGRQELDEIGPAIQAARAEGINAQGPIAADALFPLAYGGRFDGVVCMYHDQANIARKLQPRSEGATVFIGLPVPCTTTAHGTAFDIAGQGIADPGSLGAALRYAALLARKA